MTRKFQPHLNELTISEGETGLPIHSPVAVYYRQSTDAQVGNISTSIQTVDMVAELERRGWDKNDIILIDTDEGVSGTTRIDEREGMKELFELITEGKIRAVACQDEDRLFRDVTQIQVNVFIEACRKSKVQVLTPFFSYDFSHPLYGDFHARQFRFKSEMAAEYIKTYIHGKLLPAKRRLAKEGKWFGARVPVGYMVDMRKTLKNGAENPHYRKYVPFEPYARIVREYFRIFLECNGNVRKTMRRVRDERLSFPDVKPPKGFKTSYCLKERGDGYYPCRTNVVFMLTNPVYVGHWCHKNVILFYDHHQPIVPIEIFTRSFNFLSKVTLRGEPNPDYRPSVSYARPALDQKRATSRPLCCGLIQSEFEGKWIRAGVIWGSKHQSYLYVMNLSTYQGTTAKWERRANWIDRAIVSRFRQKLAMTFQSDIWTQTVKSSGATIDRERKFKRSQLAAHDEAMNNVISSIPTLTDPMFIQKVEQLYKLMQVERERLVAEIALLEDERQSQVTLDQAKALFEEASSKWDEMTPDEQRNILGLFIDRVEACDYDRSGKMRLIVKWRDQSEDQIQLWHKPHGNHWSPQDVEKLLADYDRGASQLEIAANYPDLKWCQIYAEIKKHRALVRFTPRWLGKEETYRDYMLSGGRKGKASGSFWRENEIALLQKMVRRHATQIEIMRQFPYRRWIQIKCRIKEIFGKGIRVSLSGISQRLTYIEYEQLQRTVNANAYSPATIQSHTLRVPSDCPQIGQGTIDRASECCSERSGRCS